MAQAELVTYVNQRLSTARHKDSIQKQNSHITKHDHIIFTHNSILRGPLRLCCVSNFLINTVLVERGFTYWLSADAHCMRANVFETKRMVPLKHEEASGFKVT